MSSFKPASELLRYQFIEIFVEYTGARLIQKFPTLQLTTLIHKHNRASPEVPEKDLQAIKQGAAKI